MVGNLGNLVCALVGNLVGSLVGNVVGNVVGNLVGNLLVRNLVGALVGAGVGAFRRGTVWSVVQVKSLWLTPCLSTAPRRQWPPIRTRKSLRTW